MLDIGYALSTRFPDPPQTDYRHADVRALRHDLFCGTCTSPTPRRTGNCPQPGMGAGARLRLGSLRHRGARRPGPGGLPGLRPQRAELDFTESSDRLLFERRFGWVDIEAEWLPASEPPLSFSHAELRREARDFLHDLIADLTDMHEELADNPAIWTLQARFPRLA